MRVSPLRGTRNHYDFLYIFSALVWHKSRTTYDGNRLALKNSGATLTIFRERGGTRSIQFGSNDGQTAPART